MDKTKFKRNIYRIFSDKMMVFLAFLAIPIIAIQYLKLDPKYSLVFNLVDFLIWIAFALELILKVGIEDDKLEYIKKNKLETAVSVVIVVTPIVAIIDSSFFLVPAPLRFTELTRLLRIGSFVVKTADQVNKQADSKNKNFFLVMFMNLIIIGGIFGYSYYLTLKKAVSVGETVSFSNTITISNQIYNNFTIDKSFFGVSISGLASANTNTYSVPLVMFWALGKTQGTTWFSLEPQKGVYKWKALDTEIANGQAFGNSKFIYTFMNVPSWASSYPYQTCAGGLVGCAGPISNITYWNDFVKAIATRYRGKIRYYELWNEPDSKSYWFGTKAQLVLMAQNAYQIIHLIDPNATVIAPGISVNASQKNSIWLQLYLQAGGIKYADAFAWHGYACVNCVPNANSVIECAQPIDCAGMPLVSELLDIRSGINLKNVSLYDTEGGIKSADLSFIQDPNQQAAFVSRWYILQGSYGVKTAVWNNWDPKAGLATWPAAINAYNQTFKWLTGATFLRPCTTSNNIWTCQLARKNGYQAVIIWSNNSSSAYPYTPPSAQFNQKKDLFGHIYQNCLQATFNVTYQPVLLETNTSNCVTTTTAISTTTATTTTIKPILSICLQAQGFICGNPILNSTTGFLNLTVGEKLNQTWYSPTIVFIPQGTNLTNIGTIFNTTQSTGSINIMYKGTSYNTTIASVTTPGITLGTKVNGTIWAQYFNGTAVNGTAIHYYNRLGSVNLTST